MSNACGILHISTNTSWRGGERQVYFLLKARQHEPGEEHVLLAPPSSYLAKKIRDENINVKIISGPEKMRWYSAPVLASIVKKNQIDIVHTHDSHGHSTALFSAIFFGMKKPVIVHRRVDFPITDNFFSRYKYNHSSVKAIISVSHAIQEIIAPDIRRKEILHTVHSGTDLTQKKVRKADLRHELNLPAGARFIGNIAALADHKDYPTFLRTAERVTAQDRKAYFIIAGEGGMEEEIKSKIKEMNLQDRILMLGFRSDIQSVLADLDIFFMPSKTEGLGTAILDAQAAGIPVVSTMTGGIPEMIQPEKNGFLAPPGDDKAMADFILQLLKKSSLAHKIGKEGQKTVQRFSYEKMADEIAEIYTAVCE